MSAPPFDAPVGDVEVRDLLLIRVVPDRTSAAAYVSVLIAPPAPGRPRNVTLPLGLSFPQIARSVVVLRRWRAGGRPRDLPTAVRVGLDQSRLTQPGDEVHRRQRTREEVPLCEVTPELAQGVERVLILDPLGHHRRPSVCASWIVVATIGCSQSCISMTKVRSIFSSQIGKRARRMSEEWPVPKSSTDRPTPSSCSARRTCVAITLSSICAVSVISSVSACAGRPCRQSAFRTRPGRSPSERFAVARLTLMPISRPSAHHSAAVASARSMT